MTIFQLIRRLHAGLLARRRERPALAGLRWQLLCALRSLAKGAALVVHVDPRTRERQVVVFEGQLLPQLMGAALLAHEWAQPVQPHWLSDSMLYGLSPLGADALAEGLRWWRSLPLGRRLFLRLTE